VAIRAATECDSAVLHDLILRLAAATGPGKAVTSSPEDFARHAARFEALVAEREGEPLGFCLYFPTFSSWRGEPGVYVQDLYVAKDARGTGLGRRLLAETARRARERGARYLRLSVASHNAAAREFYRSTGLAHADDECIYQAIGAAFDRLAEDPQGSER
jgi:GNAT superfamily N-acetyltransferase